VLAALAIFGAVSLILRAAPDLQRAVADRGDGCARGPLPAHGAEFVAAVQIIVYGGAIMVLFVFVIMLLNAGLEERTNFSGLATYAGIPLALAVSGFIAAAIARSGATSCPAPSGALTSTKTLSMLLFTEFVYPSS